MILALGALAFLILLNGIFAMSELAMMTSRHSRLQQSAEAGSRRARAALALAREPTRFLSTVQVGITLIGIFAGAFGEQAISGKLEPLIARIPALAPQADLISLLIVVLGITYCSLVIGELVPKRIALAHPEAVALLIARPLTVLSIIAALPVRILSASTELVLKILRIKPRDTDDVSEEDVRSLVARAATTGIFTKEEHRLFKRLMRVGDLTVRDLMVSRLDIVWLNESDTADSVRTLLGSSPYSHYPICRGDLDHIVGVVHIKDVIAYGLLADADFRVAEVAQKPMFLAQHTPALQALEQFQSRKLHVAFVIDEYGQTKGLVTLNDVTAALIGDMNRRGEAAPVSMVRRDDGSWLIDGRVPLRDLPEALGVPAEALEDHRDVTTVAGLTISMIGRIPKEGDKALWRNWRLEIIDMDGARVDKVLATPVPPPPDEDTLGE